MRRDIDDALKGWPSNSEPGEIMAREVRAKDGRKILQVRVELGLLQMEVEGRPDGARPEGFLTYLDYLRHLAESRKVRRRSAKTSPPIDWEMSGENCIEADREFLQFYHRRVAWLALQRYDHAVEDADHTLALMDFIGRYAPGAEYVAHHERFRGVVLFHRTQAAAALALEYHRPEDAIDAIHEGIKRLHQHLKAWDEEEDDSEEDELEMEFGGGAFQGDIPSVPDALLIEQLRQLELEIRRNFEVEKTLRERLNEAVEREDYEQAARLRDEIRSQSS